MSDLKLHIISFDVPYPADYGGVIDVFYKIKSLSEAGCNIYLHCFQYGRNVSKALTEYCKEVWYYPRMTGLKGLSLQYPYITYSRRNQQLRQRLIEIDAPILFEGIHSTFYAHEPALAQRMKILRAHNVESQYYQQLSGRSVGIFSKLYFSAESLLLKKFECSLLGIDAFICLSQEDAAIYKNIYPTRSVDFIGPFHPFDVSHIPTGSGSYCLYHGNLGHPENEEAAMFLLHKVIPELPDVTFIIAGKNPSESVRNAIVAIDNCALIANPDEEAMSKLIREAHINLLPTFQRSGMKLKLLYALFNGKHVIANENMLWGTGLQESCMLADTANDIKNAIRLTIDKPFTELMRDKRAAVLDLQYNNESNALKIITFLQQKSP